MRSALLAATVVVLTARPSNGQETTKPEGWVCGGPWGGLVFDVKTDPARPGRVLARTTAGEFLLEPGADERWRRVDPPDRPLGPPISLALGRLWCVAKRTSPTLISSADGTDWRSEGEIGGYVSDVIAAGPDGRVLAAGMAPVSRGLRLFVAARSDASWSELGSEVVPYRLVGGAASALLTHPADPKAILFFANLSRDGRARPRAVFLASGDGGKSWSAHEVGYALNAVAWDPQDPSALFAVELDWDAESYRLLKSTDGGKAFGAIGDDPRLAKLRTLAFAPDGKGLILGSQEGGLLRCDRDGGHVVEIGAGLPKAHVSALAVDPNRPKIVWAGTQVGMWRSDNGGGFFQRATDGLAGLQTVGFVALAGDRLACFGYHEGMRISDDGGRTWRPRSLVVSHRILLVGACGNTVLLVSRPGDRRLDCASLDRGETWTPVEVEGEPIGVGAAGEVYARGNDGRLLVSRAGGPWKSILLSLPEAAGACRPAPDGPLLLAGEDGVTILDADTGKRLAAVPAPEGERF